MESLKEFEISEFGILEFYNFKLELWNIKILELFYAQKVNFGQTNLYVLSSLSSSHLPQPLLNS